MAPADRVDRVDRADRVDLVDLVDRVDLGLEQGRGLEADLRRK